MILIIFANQNTAHLIELFLWMLAAFLLGWFLSKYFTKKEKIIVEKYVSENKSHTTSSNNNAVVIEEKETKNVQSVTETPKKKKLNFESFGTATADEKDDLKRISGIGPQIESKLNGISIFTYSQISKFTPKDITDVTDLIEFFPGRIKRDNWLGQAKKLMLGEHTEFSNRVDKGEVY